MTNFATLDAFDRAILAIVQEDCTLTHARVGARVGLSASAVRRRLEAMRASGVIAREVAIARDDALGPMVRVLVTVIFERESPAIHAAFRARMVREPAVTHCFSTAGQFDFFLIVEAESLAAYEAWGERTLMGDPDIRRYDSFVVWSVVKATTARPALSRAG
jgi:DNA-binding Lrp family transcriptional regulator